MAPTNYSNTELLKRYLDGVITDAEAVQLFRWLKESPWEHNADLEQLLINVYHDSFGLKSTMLIPKEGGLEKLLKRINSSEDSGKPVVRTLSFRWWWAAAALIFMVGTGYYFFIQQDGKEQLKIAATSGKNDVPAPKTVNAYLILSDGSTVVLDSVGNGIIANQGSVMVLKLDDGKIAYTGSSQEVMINTLHNPRGSKVMGITLADGSKVWLNAESSIKYPTVFSGKERGVEVTGEAYFEIAPNKSMPFIVKNKEASIKVLGTHFNVNAYGDEKLINVTLLEGKVTVSSQKSKNSFTLSPGQQARIGENGGVEIASNVDEEKVMAWKNGKFQFKFTSLASIMKETARWYDVEVVYEDDAVKTEKFTGAIARKENISEVLKMLELTGTIHFKTEGRTIRISK